MQTKLYTSKNAYICILNKTNLGKFCHLILRNAYVTSVNFTVLEENHKGCMFKSVKNPVGMKILINNSSVQML